METLVILPTLKCPVQCRFCADGLEVQRLPIMEDSVLEQLLNEAKEMKIPKFHISGGEIITPQYKDRLLNVLRKTKIGEQAKLQIGTSGQWATSDSIVKDMFKEFESAHISEICLSADKFHEERVPLQNLAKILNGLDKTEIKLNCIRVSSYKSTFEYDANLINRLGEIAKKPVVQTTLMKITRDGNAENFNVNQYKGFKNPVEVFGGIDKLKGNVSEVIYSLGKESFFHPIWGYRGISAKHNFAGLAGMAKSFIKPEDLLTDSNYDKKQLHYYRGLSEMVMIMPDGSIVPNCDWAETNDWRRARYGIYPHISLKEAERRAQSIMWRAGMVYVDFATFAAAKIKESFGTNKNYKK